MEQTALFQFSVENAMEMILVFDTKGKIIYANQAAKQKLEYGDELKGSCIDEVLAEDFVVKESVLTSDHNAGDILHNMMAYRKNRTCFPARVRFLKLEEQQLFYCAALDASTENFLEKKADNAGREAEEAQKVKTEFVANVTHELRTPVNGILGNTRELLSIETDSKKLQLLRLVERGCRDMNSIINNILDFSKLEAGKFVLEPRKFHFRNMVEYVKGNHSNRIIEKGLEFTVSVSPEIPEFVISDELRIVQVLNNLISNAFKFTSVGGIHLEIIKTAQNGKQAEIFFMVIDSGIGIAKEHQDKLFRSFSQVDASISRKYGGTGLGLNICKQLVELMGGDIHVESQPGKGSIFSFHVWVELPEEEAGKDSNGDATAGVTIADKHADEAILKHKLQSLTDNTVNEKVWKYGELENSQELEKKMSKLILSLEMENWEKAEMFAESVKQLVEEAPREVKSAALRLKMAVQRGDYAKSVAAFEALQGII